jgi:hypothetical protein
VTEPPQDWTESNEPESEAFTADHYYPPPELISKVSEPKATMSPP